MLVTEDPDAIVYTSDEVVSTLETRFSIMRDAVVNEKPHMDDAVGQFLDALYIALAEFRVDGADTVPLDDRVIDALTAMKPLCDYFLEFAALVGKSERSQVMHEAVRSFLGKALAYKHAPRDVIHFNHLWCDHYRFILRELYLGVIALLLGKRDYDEINRYLEADYLFETDRGPQTASFLGFDSYVKSLDEFRMRRLRQSRLSAAADLQRERSDLGFLSFDDVMQADFLLCVRGLLHHPQALTRWFPRTLVYAEKYERNGFDLFFSAQSKKKFQSVCVVLNVRNKADLQDRFARVSKDCSLAQWKFGGVPIPFERYMGLDALDSA